MYYPYLRGKQFDLLALEFLVKEKLWSDKIIPVIEPVRDSKTTRKIIEFFDKEQKSLFLIENPQVGTARLLEEKIYPWRLSQNSTVKKAAIITQDLTELVDSDLYIIDKKVSPPNQILQTAFSEVNKPILIPDEVRYRRWVKNPLILKQNFQVQKRIADYIEKTDDFFTYDHLYFETDGYNGFSDYALDGSIYHDKGGPSRAIALHITYFDAYLNIRIKHFVSDSNESAQNQPQKFFEALDKLAVWCQKYQDQILFTAGLKQLLSYRSAGKFPGLGSIKKWSLAHHLELVGAYLEYQDHWLKQNKGRIL